MADTPLGLRDLFTGDSASKAAKLSRKRDELTNLISDDKKDWALNREFYKGNQWTFWGRNRIEQLPLPQNGDAPRYRVRLVSNQIQPGVNHWVAQLTKNKPTITATPNTASARDRKAAQVAQDLYDSWVRQLGLYAKTQSALTHAAISQGYWFITWDALAGKLMKYMVDPNSGQPILDDELADAYKSELEAQGLDPRQFEQQVAVGEISVKVKRGEEVLLDPSATNFEDVRYAIIEEVLDPDEIMARYKVDVGPDAVPGDDPVPTIALQIRDERPKAVRRVYHMYVKPGPSLPRGRYVCWIENPNQTLIDVSWPFPFTDLPLVKFPGIEKPNSALDIPVTTSARPIQLELNRTISQVMEHKNLTLKPQMLAPAGSLRQRMTSEPGAIFEYIPVGNQVPDWRPNPPLPGYVFETMQWAQSNLDKIYNRMPTQRDQLPARVDSSSTVDMIQESVADQLAPLVQRLEASLAQAAMLMSQLAQVYYTEFRTIKVVGAGGATKVKKYLGSDLSGGFGFHAEAGSGLPRTREGKQNRIEFLLERGLIDGPTAMKHLDVADMSGVLAQIAADEEYADRAVEKLLRGEPLNPTAMQQAIAALQQGMNPETQQPLQPGEDPQQLVQQAALQPQPFENLQTKMKVLQATMTSAEFENYPPDAQERFLMHYQMVQQSVQAQNSPPPSDPPKVTMNLKATTSAPVAGEILRRSGLDVTDEEVAEEPLETWVTDSIDKPDQDTAGNDPLDDMERLLSMQHADEQHQAKTAKAAHDASLAQQNVMESHQRMSHAEEAHAEKLRQMRQPKVAPASGR